MWIQLANNMSNPVKSTSILLSTVFLLMIFSPLVTNVSSNSSSDVSIGKPNNPECVSDQTLECVLPIHTSISHEWSISVYNANVQESYNFHIDITDDSTGIIVDSDTYSMTMAANDYDTITFSTWNGWVNGTSYTITFHATRSDGSSVGNTRYFSATFQDRVDIAILSESTYGVYGIKTDISLLGLSYTQFNMDDWDNYFNSDWLSVYDKVVLPWQDQILAAPISDGGYGYYDIIGTSENKSILQDFIYSGGTVQIHLSEETENYDFSLTTAKSNLPFNMHIEPRINGNEIMYDEVSSQDPFHPVLENIDFYNFQGFNPEGIVTESIIDIDSPIPSSIPEVCAGRTEEGGYFQSILEAEISQENSILAICGYGSGGLIATTIDVETYSERADSNTFPLLGNLLSHTVSPYPSGFESLGYGTDILINNAIPSTDFSTSNPEYFVQYIESNAEVDFSYQTSTTETLEVDWEISGPTGWDGNSLYPGEVDYSEEESPVMIFCDMDLSSDTGCQQSSAWEIRLYLHDEYGNSRIIDLYIVTDDSIVDEYRPIADIQLGEQMQYHESLESLGTHTDQSGQSWPLYRISLLDSYTSILNLDASSSYDEDNTQVSGISSYDWKVYFDKPYYDDLTNVPNNYLLSSSSGGQFSYNFYNYTSLSQNLPEIFIRIDLVVYDNVGKFSEKDRMYFSIVPNDFYYVTPEIQIDLSQNQTQFDDNIITISGSVINCSSDSLISIEAAFSSSDFDLAAIDKYYLLVDGKYSVEHMLTIGSDFEIIINLQEFLLTGLNNSQRIYIKAYEVNQYDNEEIWSMISWIDIEITPPDRDFDGITNDFDDCPDEYGTSSDGLNSTKLIGCIDSDDDDWADRIDAFANDSSEWLDSDDDGVGNNADAFPNDANETRDSDRDGYGNNADDCLLIAGNSTIDLIGCPDTDGDGWSNYNDSFINNSAEWNDSDGDGMGDNADVFPNDSSETKDSDGDGVGDEEQLESEQKAETIAIISIISVLIILAILGGVFFIKRKNSNQEPQVIKEFFELPNPVELSQTYQLEQQPMEIESTDVEDSVSQEPVIESEVTDENGYTWRKMSDGTNYWWDGENWKLYENN